MKERIKEIEDRMCGIMSVLREFRGRMDALEKKDAEPITDDDHPPSLRLRIVDLTNQRDALQAEVGRLNLSIQLRDEKFSVSLGNRDDRIALLEKLLRETADPRSAKYGTRNDNEILKEAFGDDA